MFSLRKYFAINSLGHDRDALDELPAWAPARLAYEDWLSKTPLPSNIKKYCAQGWKAVYCKKLPAFLNCTLKCVHFHAKKNAHLYEGHLALKC